METATEVRYAGVVVGRAAPLRDTDGAGVFVLCAEPMPVGTPVSLKIEEAERAARVTEVVESADANLAGMRVRFVSEAEVALPSGGAAKPPAAKATAPVEAAPVAPAPVASAPVASAPVEAPPAAPPPVVTASVEAVPVEAAPAADPSTGTAVPSPVEGDGSAAAGSGKRRRKRK